jgi:hypothetical protein
MEKWKTKSRFPTFPPPRFLSLSLKNKTARRAGFALRPRRRFSPPQWSPFAPPWWETFTPPLTTGRFDWAAAVFMLPFPRNTDGAARPSAQTKLRLLSRTASFRSVCHYGRFCGGRVGGGRGGCDGVSGIRMGCPGVRRRGQLRAKVGGHLYGRVYLRQPGNGDRGRCRPPSP